MKVLSHELTLVFPSRSRFLQATIGMTVQVAVFCLVFDFFLAASRGQDPKTEPPARATQQLPINPNLPTIFVAGGSPDHNKSKGARGWGGHFLNYLPMSKGKERYFARAGSRSR